MARRRRRRKRKSPQRSELVLNFAIDASGTHYISIPYALSIQNRKLFRGARTYAVSSISLIAKTAGTNPTVLSVATVPDNWPVNNAIVKSYHLWKKMNDKVLEDNPSLKGTWSDFKPAFDADHTVKWDAGVQSLRPIDADIALSATPEEWQQAEIVFPQHTVSLDPATPGEPLPAVTRHLHILGDDDAAKDSLGIVKGYESTRSTVQTEDPADDAVDASNWMITLFDEGSSDPELIGYVVEENDKPPYDQDDYPGATTNLDGGVFQTSLACAFNPATGATKNRDVAPGFLAPCGLLKIVTDASVEAGTNILQIRLAAGDYHGCLSESIV